MQGQCQPISCQYTNACPAGLFCSAGVCVVLPSSSGSSGGASSSGSGGMIGPGSSSKASSGGSSSESGTSSGSESSSKSGTSSGGASSSKSSSSSGSGGPYVTVPLTGCPFIGYSAPVTIGGQSFQMIVDTGSTDTAVALSSCSSCGVSPEYSGGGSCSGSASDQYGSGASWSAEICSALVTVGTEMPDVNIDFAGITSQSEFFPNVDCAGAAVIPSLSEGILGLGPIDLNTFGTNADDAYFNELVQQGITDTLAVLLCSADGELWFGGYDPSYASGSPQYTPMSQSSYWAVSLTSVGLGTQSLGGADDNSVVDTGTWGFYMPTAAYSSLVANLSANGGATSTFGAGTLGSSFFVAPSPCVLPLGGQTPAQIDAALPALTLTFPGATGGSFTLSFKATQSYLVPMTDNGKTYYCAGVADNSQLGGQTIIGDSLLRANITVLDEGNTRVGFAPQTYCK